LFISSFYVFRSLFFSSFFPTAIYVIYLSPSPSCPWAASCHAALVCILLLIYIVFTIFCNLTHSLTFFVFKIHAPGKVPPLPFGFRYLILEQKQMQSGLGYCWCVCNEEQLKSTEGIYKLKKRSTASWDSKRTESAIVLGALMNIKLATTYPKQ
jgi:hypothetical protein